ncbi:CPXCG motif-containing cysteine-rich protein [Halotalea alkalilenta]|uniref:CPXCG motif-containing cysteine-rich protein n=1 Tax=Halotalea alkalilenta TaxID=376489 RepID=A0A172YCH5_9GAMM|nr:CPXCG motif-containing cysteine-rich protein [Halotalea alkalilenta]ANF56928.1 hypothetical protein A5892_05145 [Halotalea alkalilenta]
MNEEMLLPVEVECPYCGAGFELVLDLSQSDHETVEDCYWCCSPISIEVRLGADGGLETLNLKRDDEA